jgi:opacity protein-like surface antigen
MNSISTALARSIAVLHIAIVPFVGAQTPPPAAPERAGQIYFYMSGGSFNPDGNSQLRNPSGQYGLALGFGSRRSRHVAWEVEFFNHAQRVDTPFSVPPAFLTTTQGRADIDSYGLAGNVRLINPLGRFEPYVGGGIGVYRTTLEVHRTFLGLFSSDIKKSDSDIGLQLLAGVEYYFAEKGNSVGLQYRKLNLDAGFGPEVAGKVHVGGDFLFLTFRWNF